MRRISGNLIIYSFGIFFATLMLLCGCRKSGDYPHGNAIYYWRTVFRLDDTEKRFLKENSISTLYLHLFDVVRKNGHLTPHATLLFKDTLPEKTEIVPVIFISNTALNDTSEIGTLAAKIISRADKMFEKNGYKKPKEIQLDFDWTASTRDRYFGILQDAKEIMRGRDGKVSTTIRLHQLSEMPPPADYGALMVYNIGDFRDPEEKNSILNMEELRKYLHYLKQYDFPLAVALPIYQWCLVFDPSGEFRAISNDLDPENDQDFTQIDSIHWRAERYRSLPLGGDGEMVGGRLYPGDIIRRERVDYSLLISAKREIELSLGGESTKRRFILYHLDNRCIKTYENETFTKIYSNN